MADRGHYDFTFELGGGPDGDLEAKFAEIVEAADRIGVKREFGKDLLDDGEFAELAAACAADGKPMTFCVENVRLGETAPLSDAIVEAGFAMRQTCIDEEDEVVWVRHAAHGVSTKGLSELTLDDVRKMLGRALKAPGDRTANAGAELEKWAAAQEAMLQPLEAIRVAPSMSAGLNAPGMG